MKRTETNNCYFSGDSVEYLFREMAEPFVDSFEAHLPACQACSAELAAISFARLEVFDWKREEFDALPTPPIRIPYGENESAGIFAGFASSIADLFRFPSIRSAGITAAVLICVGLSWALFINNGKPDTAISAVADTRTSEREVEPSVKPLMEVTEPEIASMDVQENVAAVVDLPKARVGKAPKRSSITPVRAAVSNSSVKKPVQGDSLQARNVTKAKPLRLNQFDEETDESLRLNDLLAQVDGSR